MPVSCRPDSDGERVNKTKALTPRLLDILEGRTTHSEAGRLKYIEVCAKAGFDLTVVNDLPPLYQLAINFAVAKYKQLGHDKASNALADARLAICRQATCGFYRLLSGNERCSNSSCGCFLTDKVKDSTATCPKDLW